MVGLIWTIQLVHYPLFLDVGAAEFPGYERAHTKRMGTLLVVPAILEIATAAALVFTRPAGVPLSLIVAAGGLLVIIWTATGLVHAKIHGALVTGYDAALITRLVASNWWRTALWTLRGVTVAAMLTL